MYEMVLRLNRDVHWQIYILSSRDADIEKLLKYNVMYETSEYIAWQITSTKKEALLEYLMVWGYFYAV
jgi:hypothetical protein